MFRYSSEFSSSHWEKQTWKKILGSLSGRGTTAISYLRKGVSGGKWKSVRSVSVLVWGCPWCPWVLHCLSHLVFPSDTAQPALLRIHVTNTTRIINRLPLEGPWMFSVREQLQHSTRMRDGDRSKAKQAKNTFVHFTITKSATKSPPGPVGDWERATLAGRTRLWIYYKLFVLILVFKGGFEFWAFDFIITISLNCIIIEW